MRWDPTFFGKSRLFWPIAEAAAKVAHLPTWPTPNDLNEAFGASLPVRFVPASARPRRGPMRPEERYDARISQGGLVPTRAESWHDLLNALVWASFPRAKLALHQRQHRMIAPRIGHDGKLPGARTPEQDAVAMIDEGGVVLLRDPAGGERAVVFGHAIYEELARGAAMRVRGATYAVAVRAPDANPRGLADAALAELLSRASPIGRADLGTMAIDEALAPPP